MACELCHSKDDHEFGCPDQDSPHYTAPTTKGRLYRLEELRSAIGDNEARMAAVIQVEGKLAALTNHALRATACNVAEKLREDAATMEKYINEKDYVWAADDILLIIEHAETLKHALLKVGINTEDM